MLYRFAWILMWITFRIYFRRIDVVGLEKIDNKKPSILVANHPASFLDAMVLAVYLRRDVHFYVRGDIFKNPIVFKLFTWLHMIPIFSREHGMENVVKNHLTFERGKRILQKGHLLLIFPEGISRLSKKIEPLRKGAARVALQTAFEKGGVHDLSIQTISLYYSYHGVGSDLCIRIGEKMELDAYQSMYVELPAKAISELTKHLTEVFERNIIHVQHDSNSDLIEALLRFLYNDCLHDPESFFEKARILCNRVDQKNIEDLLVFVSDLEKYKEMLLLHGINDRALSRNSISMKKMVFNLMLTFELFLFGKLFWYIPGKFSKWIADKTVTRIDFYTSVTTGVLAFVSLTWWILFCWISLQFRWTILSILIVLSPVIAYLTMQWQYDGKDLTASYRLLKIKKRSPFIFTELEQLRTRLLY